MKPKASLDCARLVAAFLSEACRALCSQPEGRRPAPRSASLALHKAVTSYRIPGPSALNSHAEGDLGRKVGHISEVTSFPLP